MQLPGVAETCQDLSLRLGTLLNVPLNGTLNVPHVPRDHCSGHIERLGKAFWWATDNNCWQSLRVLSGEHCGKGVRWAEETGLSKSREEMLKAQTREAY